MSFKRQLKKNQEKKAVKVDIDAILDDLSKAQNETEMQQCIDKHLAIYKGDKNAVAFALSVGCTQGMPMDLYSSCMQYMGYSTDETVDYLKYFIDNHVKMGVFDKEEAEKFVNDCVNELNNGGILPQFIGEDGQTKVALVKDGVETVHNVAQLVAEAFIPNPDSLPYVRHKDGDKQNNRAENLEWCDTPEC